jgi:hypothetical protein
MLLEMPNSRDKSKSLAKLSSPHILSPLFYIGTIVEFPTGGGFPIKALSLRREGNEDDLSKIKS